MNYPTILSMRTREIPLDKDGFLKNLQDWSPEVAESLAKRGGICLEKTHWELICLFRDYYQDNAIIPIMRVMARVIVRELGAEKAKSGTLHHLFPPQPLREIARLAGLPKPPSCVP
ncbi:MAG: TusE/DsrC/DsvC family sulfur relay protein [Candidatus Eutrophobiaceae bacterium]